MRSHRVKSVRDHLNPSFAGWAKQAPTIIPLMPTPLAMQPTAYVQKSWEKRPYGTATQLEAASVHDGKDWALRVRWEGVSAAGFDFPDSLAVALPYQADSVLVLMGSPEAPIHYLRWRAHRENLQSQRATGIGKSAAGPSLKTSVQATAEGGHWTVVIARPLAAGPDVPPLRAGARERIGFALWRGSNDERAGIKAFSIDWTLMSLDA